MGSIDFSRVESYIKNNQDILKRADGHCNTCPLRKKCEKAHHKERIHGILITPDDATGHSFVMKALKKMPFILHLIPKCIFKKWSGYDSNSTLGCPVIKVDDIDKYREAYELLTEKRSRKIYASVLMYRMTFDNRYLLNICSDKEEYFEIFNGLGTSEVFIDCGAFTGDTLEAYLKNNDTPAKFIMFEPVKSNLKALKETVKKLNAGEYTEIHEAGVSDRPGALYLEEDRGAASRLSSKKSGYKVEVETIDSLSRKDVSFIKMDIEGAEEYALRGAAETVKCSSPKLAICLYHSPEDLWKLPLLIKELSDKYDNYIVRHYYGYDFTETILYVYSDKM